jgi:3-deoxy-D-manno-octulosonic-acid transferase
MMNFEDIAERLRTLNAARLVDDENALADTVAALLADGKERDRMATAAEAFAVAEAGAVDAVVAELKPFIQPLAKGSRPRARA